MARRVRYLPTKGSPREGSGNRRTMGELANTSNTWIAWTAAALVASLVHVLVDFHIGLYGTGVFEGPAGVVLPVAP